MVILRRAPLASALVIIALQETGNHTVTVKMVSQYTISNHSNILVEYDVRQNMIKQYICTRTHRHS